jgi:hypothetical protein
MVERRRRVIFIIVTALIFGGGALINDIWHTEQTSKSATLGSTTINTEAAKGSQEAALVLETLPVKGRAPKTGYERSLFGDGWQQAGACDQRNHILARDMSNVSLRSEADCTVMSGVLLDPYTGKTIQFMRGQDTSDDVQIDHVVALSDAWQKGAQALSAEQRQALANDPVELLAVDGPTNQKKGDGDAATWLPPNKDYRCRYVARQIAVKQKYTLWVTQAEHDAMKNVLLSCPGQLLPMVAQ